MTASDGYGSFLGLRGGGARGLNLPQVAQIDPYGFGEGVVLMMMLLRALHAEKDSRQAGR
jgi:hypothetical protein